VRDLSVRFGETLAVDGVQLDVAPGQILALLGPSGSGKSTLLRAVAGLETPETGHVTWDGHDMSRVPVHKRGFGLLFQDGQLFAHMDVGANIAYGLPRRRRTDRGAVGLGGTTRAENSDPGGRDGDPRGEATHGAVTSRAYLARRAAIRTWRADRVDNLLHLVDLEGYARRDVGTLSGGEQQRVTLARALAPRPRLLLLDEPLSALDAALRGRLARDMRRILRAEHVTAVFVTHDQSEAFAVADTVAVMLDGRIAQVGTPATLWRTPISEPVARFLGCRWFLDGHIHPPTSPGGPAVLRTRFGTVPVPYRLVAGPGFVSKADDAVAAATSPAAAPPQPERSVPVRVGLRPGTLRIAEHDPKMARAEIRTTTAGPIAEVTLDALGDIEVTVASRAAIGGGPALDSATLAVICTRGPADPDTRPRSGVTGRDLQ
jgi:thiamine transport system ATP-binding protein